jgi:hypothetical protein
VQEDSDESGPVGDCAGDYCAEVDKHKDSAGETEQPDRPDKNPRAAEVLHSLTKKSQAHVTITDVIHPRKGQVEHQLTLPKLRPLALKGQRFLLPEEPVQLRRHQVLRGKELPGVVCQGLARVFL